MKKLASILLASFAIVGCDNAPSSIGETVKNRLSEQKAEFESYETQAKIHNFINSKFSGDARELTSSLVRATTKLSRSINPDEVKDAIESFEMNMACALNKLTNSEDKENLIKSVKAAAGSSSYSVQDINRHIGNAQSIASQIGGNFNQFCN